MRSNALEGNVGVVRSSDVHRVRLTSPARSRAFICDVAIDSRTCARTFRGACSKRRNFHLRHRPRVVDIGLHQFLLEVHRTGLFYWGKRSHIWCFFASNISSIVQFQAIFVRAWFVQRDRTWVNDTVVRKQNSRTDFMNSKTKGCEMLWRESLITETTYLFFPPKRTLKFMVRGFPQVLNYSQVVNGSGLMDTP